MRDLFDIAPVRDMGAYPPLSAGGKPRSRRMLEAGGGAPPPTYFQTAFLDAVNGNDGTAVLNNPALPFQTADGAAYALGLAYPSGQVTLRLLDHNNSYGLILPGDISDRLTIMSHGATKFTMNYIDQVGAGGQNVYVTLDNIDIADVYYDTFYNLGNYSAVGGGVWQALTTSTIGNIYSDGYSGTTGGSGYDDYQYGDAGANGSDNDPDGDPGGNGSSPISSAIGGNGDFGTDGSGAWNITFDGPLTVSFWYAQGGIGGDGGPGGYAYSEGGAGGNGGNAMGDPDGNGGNGGNGGDGYDAWGGNGGNGGNGGDGGSGTRLNGANVISYYIYGGAAGGYGYGTSGDSYGGAAGLGGSATGAGTPGVDGMAGNSGYPLSGGDGSIGSAGATGSML